VVRPPRLEARVGGELLRGVTAAVQNGDPYTYFGSRPVHLAEGLALDDGQFGGVMLERATPIDIPTVSARLLSDRLRLADHKRISAFTTSDEVRIASADGRPVALQVDGDYIGDTAEAVFGVWPGALAVVA
jgi:diacylglycerol kinase family enzyme